MTRFVSGSLLATRLATGTAVAQTQTTPPAATIPTQPWKRSSRPPIRTTGSLEGAEVEAFKGKLARST